MQLPTSIVFEAVTKSFDNKMVLHNVCYKVPGGEALCIMGKSGTGKTVILKLLIGVFKPDHGKIYVNTEDIVPLTPKGTLRIQRAMGLVSQNAPLLDFYSLYDNLVMPLREYTTKSNREIADNVNDLLSSLGLTAEKNKLPVELSSGMRKRAGLACALLLKPRILLVDEPTSGLDPDTAAGIDRLLLKIKERGDTTMIIVTHDIRGVQRLGSRILILDQGNVLAIGTLSELKESNQEVVRALTSKSQDRNRNATFM